MQLVAGAYLKRQAARQALREGRHAEARLLASQAQGLHATPLGRRLAVLAEWLDTGCSDSP